MILRIKHTTRFLYPNPVTDSHTELRLMPVSDEHQNRMEYRLQVSPPARVFQFESPYGVIQNFNMREPHAELSITAESRVNSLLTNPFDGLNLQEDDWAYYRDGGARSDSPEFLTATILVPHEPAVQVIAQDSLEACRQNVASFLLALNTLIFNLINYEKDSTTVHTTLTEILEDKRGVCQDFAHLMLAVCRSQGIPARYVSGYLLSLPGDGTMHADQAMHAWVECLFPDGEWRGFDPTNNLMVNDHYVKVHVGRDYKDVAPTRGVYRGAGEERLVVAVAVSGE